MAANYNVPSADNDGYHAASGCPTLGIAASKTLEHAGFAHKCRPCRWYECQPSSTCHVAQWGHRRGWG